MLNSLEDRLLTIPVTEEKIAHYIYEKVRMFGTPSWAEVPPCTREAYLALATVIVNHCRPLPPYLTKEITAALEKVTKVEGVNDGKPVIRRTHTPAALIVKMQRNGLSTAAIRKEFPTLTTGEIEAVDIYRIFHREEFLEPQVPIPEEDFYCQIRNIGDIPTVELSPKRAPPPRSAGSAEEDTERQGQR